MAIDHVFASSENTATKMFVSDKLKDIKELRKNFNGFFDFAFVVEQEGQVKYGVIQKHQKEDYNSISDLAIYFHNAVSMIDDYLNLSDKSTMEIHTKISYKDIDGQRETHMVLSSGLGDIQNMPKPEEYIHNTDVTTAGDKYFRVQSYSYQTSSAKQIEQETLLATNLIKVLQEKLFLPGHLNTGIAVNHTIDDKNVREILSLENAKYDTLRV